MLWRSHNRNNTPEILCSFPPPSVYISEFHDDLDFTSVIIDNERCVILYYISYLYSNFLFIFILYNFYPALPPWAQGGSQEVHTTSY